MTKEEAEEFVEQWWMSNEKIFKYRREFFADDYVVIAKKEDGIFPVDTTRSTYKKFTKFYRAEIIKMLMDQTLVYYSDNRSSIDCVYLKTGGCECGAYLNINWGHSQSCRLRHKNGI